MRTQIVLCAVGAACVLFAAALALRGQAVRASEQQAHRAAQEARAATEAADDSATVELAAPRSSAEESSGDPTSAVPSAGERRELGADALATLASGDLLEELRAARARGVVGDGELAEFLARIYLQRGETERAYALLVEHHSQDFGLWWGVAEAFGMSGNEARQQEVLLAMLALWPDHPTLLDQLQALDPGQVVTRLRAQLGQQPAPGDPGLRARLARALLASGARDEARALIEALLAEQPGDLESIALLAQLDPGAALARFEQSFGSSEEQVNVRAAMLDILIGTGNPEAAEGVLARAQREGFAIDPGEWGMVAEGWLASGDTARGTSALFQALGCEQGDPDSWVHSLEGLAPADLLRELERRTASDARANDEYWGSLADSYWHAGRHAEARAAWERAYELDREDGEWPMRLEALRAGRDPFDG